MERHEEDRLKLGFWVKVVRAKKSRLTPDQLKRLNSLSFSWDSPHTEQWEQNFAALQKFHKREGHCRVALKHKEDGLKLGGWIRNQRSRKSRLTPDQLKRLNSLGFSWDPITEQWEQNFAALQKFHKREGHCRVALKHKEDGLKLGTWVSCQRARKSQLAPDQLKRLNSLSFSWDPITEQWEQNFAALQKFHKREGHCRVAPRHKEDNLKLSLWISNQRARKSRLTPNQLKRLNSLGFSWDPITEQWEQNFAALQKFHKREGHCRVAAKHQEDGLKLGTWVNFYRLKKDELTPDQLERLNSLGFSWDPITEQWEQNFAALQKFHKREGHCRVPQCHQEGSLKLGSWVTRQRAEKTRLTPDQLKRLNALDFSWDPIAEQWEQGFAALQKFHKREGHCRAAALYEEDGLKLGLWVRNQRARKSRLTPNKLKRLNSLGFIWDSLDEQWEQNFAALQKFHEREGHCRVPAKRRVGWLNLGGWVRKQRAVKNQLSPDRLNRLNSLDFFGKA